MKKNTLTLENSCPELFEELHLVKNGDQKLSDIFAGSSLKVWWLGKCGHEWEAAVQARVKQKTGCPYCSNRKLLSGFNDLSSRFPILASQWDNEKNSLSPSEVLSGSTLKAYWRCEKDHGWEAQIRTRTRKNATNCPYCSGNKLLPGENDLATLRPDLANLWDYEKNGDLTPSDVFSSGMKKVWWKCENGHSSYATVNYRSRNNCGYCSNQSLLEGFNDFATTHPEIAKEWHPDKNSISPKQCFYGSSYHAWWLGECGHEWKTYVFKRTAGSGCPFCSGNKILKGFNDFATKNPELLKSWHPTKNDISPHDIPTVYSEKVWWLGECGHEWASLISSYKSNPTCPDCRTKNYVSAAEKEIYEFITSFGITVEQTNYSFLRGKELDLLIPSHKIAIEFNGLYWHTEKAGKDRNYHFNKWKTCYDKGYQLIQIWEDDWQTKKEIIKKMLLHKLHTSPLVKVSARNTFLIKLNLQEARNFLNIYHIQGFSSGSVYLGLKNFDDDLVAVAVFKKRDKNSEGYELVRFATSEHVVGGFSKILNNFIKIYSPSEISTFSDNMISDGNLYLKNGFSKDSVLPPDYMYIVNRRRKHKFNYRKDKFKNDETLKYVENFTERELADLNNFDRIWDAGKTKWVLSIK